MKDELTADVQRICAEYDRAAARWLERRRGRDGVVHCRRGCGYCCDMSVKITWAEALALLPHLGPEQRAAAAEKARWAAALVADLRDAEEYFPRYRQEVGPCPLLAADGSCALHTHRPLICRAVLSVLPGRYCRRDLAHRMDETAIRAAVAGLDPLVHDGTPYLLPLIRFSETYHRRLLRLTPDTPFPEGILPVLLTLAAAADPHKESKKYNHPLLLDRAGFAG